MITSHQLSPSRQNYGYYSRSFPERRPEIAVLRSKVRECAGSDSFAATAQYEV